MNNKKAFVLFLSIFLFLCINLSSAANVGVSPADANFKNVLRNGYAERPITISVDAEDSVDIKLTPWGDISDWILVSEDEFEVNSGQPKRVIVSVNPPIDIPNGNYTGFIRINSSRLGAPPGAGTTSFVVPVLDVAVNVEITDIEVRECEASNFQILSAEKGDDVIFTSDVLNEGNIKFWPEFTFDIWDQESINLVDQFSFSDIEVTPTRSEKFIIKIPTDDLAIGQYWVDIVAVDCYNERTMTFDVLEEGALRADGVLERIVVEPWADVGDTVQISATFKNTGEKSLDARFEGKITQNGKIVQILESDQELFVGLDSQESFTFFFTPKDPGKYIISGRIFYDSKRTYEQSAVLNVRPKGSIFWNVIKFLLYAVLLIIIAVLIYLIRKERKSYRLRLRRLRR